jgi:hypothetical protein
LYDPARQFGMYAAKVAFFAFVEDANEVDHDIHAGELALQVALVQSADFNDLHPWMHQQIAVTFAVAREHANGIVRVLRQMRNEVAADEAGAAKNAKSSVHDSVLAIDEAGIVRV